MQICQNGPLDKFMRPSTSCIVTYSRIKIMSYRFMWHVLDLHKTSYHSHFTVCTGSTSKLPPRLPVSHIQSWLQQIHYCRYTHWDGLWRFHKTRAPVFSIHIAYLLFIDGFMGVETVCLLAFQFFQIDLYGGFLVLTLWRLGGVVGQLPSHLFNLWLIIVQHSIQLILFLLTFNLRNTKYHVYANRMQAERSNFIFNSCVIFW